MELEEEQPMQAKLITQLKADITTAPPPTENSDNSNDGTAQLKKLEEEMPLQGKFIVQKKELEEEMPMQGKFIAQRMELEEEQPIQGKFIIQRKEREEQVPIQPKFKIPSSAPTEPKPFQRFALPKSNEPAVVQAPIQRFVLPTQPIQKKANNTGLPDNLKAGVENLSGFSMDDVKVHYNSAKPAQLHAHAYAQGTDIHIAPGQEKHLPHEAWHVVQQKQGRVKPTMQMKGKVNVNDDKGLEKEADVMGPKATQLKFQSNQSHIAKSFETKPIIQRKITFKDNPTSPDQALIEAKQYLTDYLFGYYPNIVKEVLSTKPKAITQHINLSILNHSQALIYMVDLWAKYPAIFTYTKNFKGGFKIIKDSIKNWLNIQFNWRSVGAAEYMTGDATGLALAPLLDPSLTVKILRGKQAAAKAGPTFLEGAEKRLPVVFSGPNEGGNILHSPTDTKPHYMGTSERYGKRYNKHFKEAKKPWNKETYEVTDVIGKKFASKRNQEIIRQKLLPGKSAEDLQKSIRRYKAEIWDREIGRKACVFLWGRTSGKSGGAHKELDSNTGTMMQLAKMIHSRFPDRVLIIIGDEVVKKDQLEAAGIDNHLVYMGPFWKDNDFLKDRNAQRYFMQLFHEQNNAISIGMRSGSLEGMALLNMKVIFLDDKGNNAEDRMEFWAGEGANTRKDKHYEINKVSAQDLALPKLHMDAAFAKTAQAMTIGVSLPHQLKLLKSAKLHFDFAELLLKALSAKQQISKWVYEKETEGPMKSYKRLATLLQLGDQVEEREATFLDLRSAIKLINGNDLMGAPICDSIGNPKGNGILEPFLGKPISISILGGKMSDDPKMMKTYIEELKRLSSDIKTSGYENKDTVAIQGSFKFNKEVVAGILKNLPTTELGQTASKLLNGLNEKQDYTGHLLLQDYSSKGGANLLNRINKLVNDKALKGFNENFVEMQKFFNGIDVKKNTGAKFKLTDVKAILELISFLERNNNLQENELSQLEFLIEYLSI